MKRFQKTLCYVICSVFLLTSPMTAYAAPEIQAPSYILMEANQLPAHQRHILLTVK